MPVRGTRPDRTVDRITPEMRDLVRAQDGAEVKAQELETLTDKSRAPSRRRDTWPSYAAFDHSRRSETEA
ncbi:MAG: hypothetical protein OXI22_23310 [Defluviicoccus sp.]|nr:hypothetical protein [Defluviicoccus sp.]MDE0386829.1 hypothetical protein [Defluviicoccus sp.]